MSEAASTTTDRPKNRHDRRRIQSIERRQGEATDTDRPMTVREAADFLRIREDYLNRLRVQGKGPRHYQARKGARVTYDRCDLEAYRDRRVLPEITVEKVPTREKPRMLPPEYRCRLA